jgi:hypothetical protein
MIPPSPWGGIRPSETIPPNPRDQSGPGDDGTIAAAVAVAILYLTTLFFTSELLELIPFDKVSESVQSRQK